MTEFILVITELYTEYRWFSSPCLRQPCALVFSAHLFYAYSYLAYALYAREEDLRQKKNQAHSFARPFPWKRLSNEAMALSFILIDGSSHKIFLKSEFRYWADYHWNTVALIEMAVIYSQLYSQLLLNL